MKKIHIIFLYFLSLIFNSCSDKSLQVSHENNDASRIIYRKIVEVEDEVKKLKEGKKASFNSLGELVCLTGISPKNASYTSGGIFFIPNENDIQKWKEWYKLNKKKISYSKQKRKNVPKEELVIMVEYEKGKFRNNDCQ